MASLIPDGLVIPPGVDLRQYLLSLPAMTPDRIPLGADTTMTTSGPNRVWFWVTAISCITIPGLFFALRLYTRLAIIRSLELTDYLLFLAYPLIVTQTGMGYMMIKNGAGVHQWQVTVGQLFNQLYWANIAQIIYCPLNFLVKIAVLCQYLKLFAPTRKFNLLMWYGAWSITVTLFIVYTFFTYWTIWYCRPRRAIWDKLVENAQCRDINVVILTQGAFNMASDVVILCLPTISLWRLNMARERKFFLTLLFSTGLLACIASGMRIYFTIVVTPVHAGADISHNSLFIGLWTEAEVSFAFIVACALCLPKLARTKGKRIRVALSHLPFSSFHNALRHTSKPCKNPSQFNQLVDLQPIDPPEPCHPRRQELGSIPRLYPGRDSFDLTIRSSSDRSSECPASGQLGSINQDQYNLWPAPLKISRTAIVPVKLDLEHKPPKTSMLEEDCTLQNPNSKPPKRNSSNNSHRRIRSLPCF